MVFMLQQGKRDIIRLKDGSHVLVATDLTSDYGWETMVFECNSSGQVKSYADLDCDRCGDAEGEWERMHDRMCDIWSETPCLPKTDAWGFRI